MDSINKVEDVGIVLTSEIIKFVTLRNVTNEQAGELLKALLNNEDVVNIKDTLVQIIYGTLAKSYEIANTKRKRAIENNRQRIRRFRENKTDVTLRNGDETLRNAKVRLGKVSIYTPIIPKGDDTEDFQNHEDETTQEIFEVIWEAHPRKENIQAAKRAFERSKKTPRQLLDLHGEWIERWMASGRESQFAPTLAKWISGERWTDEIIPEKNSGAESSADEMQHDTGTEFV